MEGILGTTLKIRVKVSIFLWFGVMSLHGHCCKAQIPSAGLWDQSCILGEEGLIWHKIASAEG